MSKLIKFHTFVLNDKKLQKLKCFLNVFNSSDVRKLESIDKVYHNDLFVLLEHNETSKISIARILTKNGKVGYIFISNKKTQQLKEYHVT